MNCKYSNDFLRNSFVGCLNNKSEVLSGEYCGCFNCLEITSSTNITEWISEPNGKEDSASCPNCNFDSVLSYKYPVEDPEFLEQMHYFHFGGQE